MVNLIFSFEIYFTPFFIIFFYKCTMYMYDSFLRIYGILYYTLTTVDRKKKKKKTFFVFPGLSVPISIY